MDFIQELNTFLIYNNASYEQLTSDYRYKYALPFERIPDPKSLTVEVFQRYWHHSITISIVYFAIIKAIQTFMTDRKPLSLQLPLILWNGALAVFSIIGFVRFTEDLVESLSNRGWYQSLCYSVQPNDVAAYWSLLFAISKIVELGDTLFIVLRKKPLIFLHYYHHAAVLIYTIHSGAEHTAAGRVFISMNLLAHSCMYTYYTVAAMRIRVPKWVSMAVTTVQTTQMLAGVGVSCAVYQIKTEHGWPCQQSMANLYLAFTIYVTFAILFMQFFYKAYIVKRDAKVKKQ